jgi:hypothetical protein
MFLEFPGLCGERMGLANSPLLEHKMLKCKLYSATRATTSACAGSLMDQVRSISFPRWGQPAQQQGLRIPSFSSLRTLSILRRLVSGFLASSIQQIHSLRASGVMASHSASAALSAVRVLRKSSGTLCTTPVAISFLDIIILSTLLLEHVTVVHYLVSAAGTFPSKMHLASLGAITPWEIT